MYVWFVPRDHHLRNTRSIPCATSNALIHAPAGVVVYLSATAGSRRAAAVVSACDDWLGSRTCIYTSAAIPPQAFALGVATCMDGVFPRFFATRAESSFHDSVLRLCAAGLAADSNDSSSPAAIAFSFVVIRRCDAVILYIPHRDHIVLFRCHYDIERAARVRSSALFLQLLS